MKKIILFAAVVIFIASCNNSNSKGWTAAQRSQFVSDCTGAATTMGAEKAKSYCECMQPKIEAKYPSFQKANQITTTDLQSEEWIKRLKTVSNNTTFIY